MLKITQLSNVATKKANTSFSMPTKQTRQISVKASKNVASNPFLLKSLTQMNVLSAPKVSMNVRSFCEDFSDFGSAEKMGGNRGFRRNNRPPRGEGSFGRNPRIQNEVLVIKGLTESKENEAEIRKIFPTGEIIPDGIKVLKDSKGKSLNTVFVEFSSAEEATKALDLYRETSRSTERDPENPPVSIRPSSSEERADAVASATTPSTYVFIRRLPFGATDEEVKGLFAGLKVEAVTTGNGNASVKFATVDDATKALEKNNTEFARRQIQVGPCLEMDFKYNAARPPKIIRVRGAPSSATEADFRKFFEGLEITRFNATSREGIAGRIVPGDVFIEFATPDDAAKALKMDRQNMGDRYLQIYKSAVRERMARTNPNRNQGRGGFGGNFGGQNSFGRQDHEFA